MHRDLEAIIAADEECRSRVTLAESRRERDIAAAHAKRDAAIEARRKSAAGALDRELSAIRAEGDARLSELRDKQKTYLATLAKSGEENFDAAIEKYLSVLSGTERR